MPAGNDTQIAKPLIFCPRSILAWQRGAKTQTRRLMKTLTGIQPLEGLSVVQSEGIWVAQGEIAFELLHQPYALGDVLWIREALVRSDDDMVLYAADSVACPDLTHRIDEVGLPQAIWNWKRNTPPAMFMPRWACRYYARVVSMRPERLQDISVEDCVAEGMPAYTRAKGVLSATPPDHRWWYIEWWNALHRKPEHKWESNPWVWVYGLEDANGSTE